MFGKHPCVTPLEVRKQLLIAESELNRAQLVGDLASLSLGVRMLTGRAGSFGWIVSSVQALAAGLTAFRREKQERSGGKPSRMKALLRFAGIASTLWLAFRSSPPPDRDP